jgi:rhamnulokinase
MLDAIFAQLEETGALAQFRSSHPALVTKTILDSLALRYASVLRAIQALTGRRIEGVHIVGGGSQNEYLNQATSTATRLPVIAGPVEATVIGNVLVQSIAAGRFSSLAEARGFVGQRAVVKRYEPEPSRAWEEAEQRYREIEQRYIQNDDTDE